jgi:hypothetical protein
VKARFHAESEPIGAQQAKEMHMIAKAMRTKKWLASAAVGAFIILAAALGHADTWRGTAPFCDGKCLAGERAVATSNCGNGGCCWSGHKVLCTNAAPTCSALQTKTSCAGVVMICDNGHYEVQIVSGVPTNKWVSCGKYACGACFGF